MRATLNCDRGDNLLEVIAYLIRKKQTILFKIVKKAVALNGKIVSFYLKYNENSH